MRQAVRAVALALIASGISTLASATGSQWTEPLQISHIEIVGSGGFILYFAGFYDSNCSSDPTGIYVYPNAEGVTSTGVNQMLATALMVQATGGTLSMLYDDTGNVSAGLCFGELLKE